MMIIRPVAHDDLPQLMAMAEKTGGGLTSLPADKQTLHDRIERSVQTWQGNLPRADQGYVFVMVDAAENRAVGICAIEVAVGLQDPWYNFHVGNQVHASKELNVYNAMPTLSLSNDHTGSSELCTLFLDPDHRVGKNGYLLSKSRFLFIAAFRERFADKMVAEMRGVSDEKGFSPFWADVGQRFFSMAFSDADKLSGTGRKAFIAELMPKHPLYIDYLSAPAQAVIGETHPQTAPARAVLEAEGFRYHNYIDIFDGGPTLECDTSRIRAVRKSRLQTAVIVEQHDPALPLCLVANENYHHYRATLLRADPDSDSLALESRAAQALLCQPGDRLRVVKLCLEEKKA
ncbi:arginine N-succinyltransferase [Enterobacterales bacterium CwR94]|nr:arginine N-succinyltransferase [Enterobacterales bacterium CwR94]